MSGSALAALEDPLLLGVLSGLATAALTALLGMVITRVNTPRQLLGRLFGYGVIGEFSTLPRAERDLERSILSSEKLDFMAIRGYPLAQEVQPIRRILDQNEAKRKSISMRVLIADPNSDEAKFRAKEFSDLQVVQPETYLKQIKDSLNSLADMRRRYPNVLVRLHTEPAAFRIIVCDSACYLGLYTRQLRGETSPVVKIKAGSLLYRGFERYFERVWERSHHSDGPS